MELLEGDERETLAAALSFVENYESPGEHEDASDSERAPSPARKRALAAPKAVQSETERTVRTKKAGVYNSNRARDERKNELIYLRSKVREMEDELDGLRNTTAGSATAVPGEREQTRVKSKHAHTLRGAADAVRILTRDWVASARVSHSSIWKAAASRQYAERHKAELENMRLKMVLEAQIKVAKSLQRLLRKQLNMQLQHQSSGKDGKKKRQHCPLPALGSEHPDEDSIFERLLAGLENAVLEADAVFKVNGLSNTEHPCHDAVIRDHGVRGRYLEVFANKIVPFDILATANAVYEHFTRAIKRMPFRSYYEPKQTEVDDNTFMESFGIGLQAKRTTGDFRVLKVIRRYVQEDRIVIAWQSCLEPVIFSSQPAKSIRVHESGYVVIKRPQTLSQEYSLIQTCYVMTPTADDPDASLESMVDQITHFFLDSSARNMYMSHQMIENSLMDDYMKQKRQEVAVA